MQQTQTVYVPVEVKDRLPEIDGYYICHYCAEWEEYPFMEGKFWLSYDWENEIGEPFNDWYPVYWLEKREGVIVLTPEELKKIISEKDLIIHGINEGSEIWKAEYNNCRVLLNELVALKELKDKEGKTNDYLFRQPLAWEQAKEFLKNYQHFSG
jgi:hypothetical protein